MKKLHTYKELIEEKERLSILLAQRKVAVQVEFEEIKEKLKPAKAAWEWVQKFTSKDKSNPLLNVGIDVGVNLILKKFILRNAGFVMRLVMPFLVKNFLSHEATEKDNILTRVGKLFKGNFFDNIKKQFTQQTA